MPSFLELLVEKEIDLNFWDALSRNNQIHKMLRMVAEQKGKVSKVPPDDSSAKQMIPPSWSLEFYHLSCLWTLILIFGVSFVSVKVLLEGLYDQDCSLNLLKRDKDGIARNYTNVLERIWEFTTKWPNWEVLNKSSISSSMSLRTGRLRCQHHCHWHHQRDPQGLTIIKIIIKIIRNT